MLSNIVGTVDQNAAFVLIVMFITVCIVLTASIVKRRSRLIINNEFVLAKIKQSDDAGRAQYALETEREFKLGQLKENLITSHRETPMVESGSKAKK